MYMLARGKLGESSLMLLHQWHGVSLPVFIDHLYVLFAKPRLLLFIIVYLVMEAVHVCGILRDVRGQLCGVSQPVPGPVSPPLPPALVAWRVDCSSSYRKW